MYLLCKAAWGTRLTLVCAALLLVLPEHGRPQCYMAIPRTNGHVSASCCQEVSNSPINDSIVSCYEHNATTFPQCRVHAFIFTTSNNKTYCVDPAAKWLKRRFRRLENRGICCQLLHKKTNRSP